METRRLAVAARRPLEAHAYHALRSLLLLVLAFAIQILGLPQLITGTVVNGVLLAAALTSPPFYGASVGALTPVVALWRGIIPPAAVPMVPFIAAGNALLVVVFRAFNRIGRRWAQWVGAVVAACLKAAFLATAATQFVTVPPKVQAMMSTPQLITALLGAVVVLGLGPVAKRGFLRLIGWDSEEPRA